MLKIKVAGTTDEGKTSKLLDFCLMEVMNNSKVLFISSEEKAIELCRRFDKIAPNNSFFNMKREAVVRFIDAERLDDFEDILEYYKDMDFDVLILDGMLAYHIDSVDNFLHTDKFKTFYSSKQLRRNSHE